MSPNCNILKSLTSLTADYTNVSDALHSEAPPRPQSSNILVPVLSSQPRINPPIDPLVAAVKHRRGTASRGITLPRTSSNFTSRLLTRGLSGRYSLPLNPRVPASAD